MRSQKVTSVPSAFCSPVETWATNTGSLVSSNRANTCREVDLDVPTRVGPAGDDSEGGVVHPSPDGVVDGGLVISGGEVGPGDVAGELLERPHRLLRFSTELSVDGAGLEPEIGQPLLKTDHVITKRSPRPRWKPAVQPPEPSQRVNGRPLPVGIGTRGDRCVWRDCRVDLTTPTATSPPTTNTTAAAATSHDRPPET